MGKWANYVNEGSHSSQNVDQWMTKEEQEDIVAAGNSVPGSYTQPDEPNFFQEAPANAFDDERVNTHFTPTWFMEESNNLKNPDYQPTSGMDREYVDAIANYVGKMKEQNPEQWKYGDPGWSEGNKVWEEYIRPFEQTYRQQQREAQAIELQQQQNGQSNAAEAIELAKNDPATSKFFVNHEDSDVKNLKPSEKVFWYGTPAAAGTDVKNQDELSKWTQPALSAFFTSGGTAKLARDAMALAGVPTTVGKIAYVGARSATGLYSYGKMRGWWQGNETADKVLQLMDLPDEKLQQFQGALAYGFEKTGGGDLSDPRKIGENLAHLANNFGDIMHYSFGSGRASTEYDPELVGIVTGLTANMGADALSGGGWLSRQVVNGLATLLDEDPEYIGKGQVKRANQGLTGVYDLPEELTGTNAITTMLEAGQYLIDKYGITDKADKEYIINYLVGNIYGDTGNLSEFIEHEFTDPSNIAENMEARAVNAYANVTGDVNLQKAAQANMGTLAGDLTGNIPVIPDIIRAIGKMTGNPDILKTSGGMETILQQWDIENKTNPTEDLTARDRRFSKISDDNTSTEFTPNTYTHKVSLNPKQILENIHYLVSETNDSKAVREGDAIFDFISAGIDSVMSSNPNETDAEKIQHITEYIDELENPNNISPDSPFYESTQSILFNDIKDDIAAGIKARRADINKQIERYAALSANRQTLEVVATALNVTPQKVLDMYQNEKVKLTQMIVDKADQNGGTLPGIDINVEDGAFGERVIGMLEPFTVENSQAWNRQMLMVQLTTNMADGIADSLVAKYGIKPESLLIRFGDTVKKIQHLLLLGLSPSYLANNFVNNIATRTALGYGGYMTPNTINSWMGRFGYAPQRISDSLSSDTGFASTNAKDSGHEVLAGKIKAGKKAAGSGFKKNLGKAMDTISQAGQAISDKAGIFSNISGNVEAMESKQITVAAMMNYMARTWKEGVNFRKMPAQLEAAIEAQNPGMSAAIYAAVRGGINMTEIENAVYGTYIAPNVMDSLLRSAQILGVDKAEDFINEYFVNNGMMAQLEEALRNKRGDDVDRIVKQFSDDLKNTLKYQLSSDLAVRAEAIQNDVTNAQFTAAVQLGMDLSDQMSDMWMESQSENNRVFQRRVEEGMTPEQFRELYQQHQKNLTERWKNVYATEKQTFSGILKGLGMSTEATSAYIDNLQRQREAWVEFYEKTQPALFQKYIDAMAYQPGDTFISRGQDGSIRHRGTWDIRVEKAWKTYLKEVKQAVATVRKVERATQKAMDTAFIKGLKEALGETKAAEIDKTIALKLEEIRNKRQQIIEQDSAVRKIADNTKNVLEKNQAYLEADAKRTQLKVDYNRLQQELYADIDALKPFTMTNPPVATSPVDVDHAARIRADIAEEQADDMQKVYQQYADKATDQAIDNDGKIGDVSIEIDIDGEKVTLSSEEMSKQQIQPMEETIVDPARQAQSQANFQNGMFVPVEDIDLSTIQPSGRKDAEAMKLAQQLSEQYNTELQERENNGEKIKPYERLTLQDWINFIYNRDDQQLISNDKKNWMLGSIRLADMTRPIEAENDITLEQQIDALKYNRRYQGDVPQSGTYVAQTFTFDHGGSEIVAIVTDNGKTVAYVPADFQMTSVDFEGRTIPVLGLSPTDPDLYVYKDGDVVKTEKRREDPGTNPYAGEMNSNTMPMPDPLPQAHNEVAYNQVFDLLTEFARLYKQNVDNNMTSQKFDSLDENTRSQIRSYIDEVVRQDLQNTKFKAGKFGEMMRDTALLNYNKRYGFDNYLTLIAPYQFWQTRSFINWFMRTGTKGGKLWRKYAKLKELEERNQKEFMPSKISGKFGIPVPGMPDWMGGGIFMPTDQLLVVNQFIDPIIDYISGKQNNAVIAAAERYLQEDYEEGKISWTQYQAAMNTETREQDGVWQEAVARAKLTEKDDNSFANLMNQYFGLPLPLSIMKAVEKGDNGEWNQWPITRTGTALRAFIGNNWLGKGAEDVLSAPEKALRNAVVSATGDDSFAYNEFGAFGDYYIRLMVYDMVVEGKISPEDATQATIERDGNKYWEQAADRVREEMLVKMQGGAVVDAGKKLFSGDGNTLDNFYYLLAAIATAPLSKNIVHEAEPEWRKNNAELSATYTNNDTEARNKFYEDNPNHRYNSQRWEGDDEQRLRKYLYNNIMQEWYSLSKAEQQQLEMSFGGEFRQDVLDKDTRAIESMDIDRLAAYAQALHGSVPYIATDKLNTTKIPEINVMPIADSHMDAYNVYRNERDRLYPGMAGVNSLYYDLPADQRKVFADANPKLVEYQQWDSQYKKTHPEVKQFSRLVTDFYDMKEAEQVIGMMDKVTYKELAVAAFSGKQPGDEFKSTIEMYMRQSGSTKTYKQFVQNLMDYILIN